MTIPNSENDATSAPGQIADIEKNSREVVRCEITNWKGNDLFRAWNFYRDGGELKPGRGGVSLRVDRLPQLHAAVTKALEVARASGLIEADNGRG